MKNVLLILSGCVLVSVSGFSAGLSPKSKSISLPVSPTPVRGQVVAMIQTRYHTPQPLHMALIDPTNETVAFLRPPTKEPLPPLEAVSLTTTAPSTSFESDYVVAQSRSSPLPFWEQPNLLAGRLMALTAAAMYGTNFASIKLLNDSLPVSLAGSLRFGMGALGFGIFVLWAERNRDKEKQGEQYFQVYESREEIIPVSKAELHKERTDATWAGAEVGLWYAVGCIAQAIALLEVDASKVSKKLKMLCGSRRWTSYHTVWYLPCYHAFTTLLTQSPYFSLDRVPFSMQPPFW